MRGFLILVVVFAVMLIARGHHFTMLSTGPMPAVNVP